MAVHLLHLLKFNIPQMIIKGSAVTQIICQGQLFALLNTNTHTAQGVCAAVGSLWSRRSSDSFRCTCRPAWTSSPGCVERDRMFIRVLLRKFLICRCNSRRLRSPYSRKLWNNEVWLASSVSLVRSFHFGCVAMFLVWFTAPVWTQNWALQFTGMLIRC